MCVCVCVCVYVLCSTGAPGPEEEGGVTSRRLLGYGRQGRETSAAGGSGLERRAEELEKVRDPLYSAFHHAAGSLMALRRKAGFTSRFKSDSFPQSI